MLLPWIDPVSGTSLWHEKVSYVQFHSVAPRSTLGRVPDALPASGSVSTKVAATPDELWRIFSDPLTWAEFSSELQEAHYVDGEGPKVGAVIAGRNQRGDFSWTTESFVTRCVPPTLLEWATGDREQPTATWTLVATDAEGGTTLTHSVVLHPDVAPLGPAVANDPDHAHDIVQSRLNDILANMQSNLDGIASTVATRPPS